MAQLSMNSTAPIDRDLLNELSEMIRSLDAIAERTDEIADQFSDENPLGELTTTSGLIARAQESLAEVLGFAFTQSKLDAQKENDR